MRGASRFLLAIILGGVFTTVGWAQESRATLGGRVTDTSGAVVVGATVTVTSDDTQVKQQTQSNGQGEWRVSFLNPGHYSVAVAFEGFKTAELHGIALNTADVKQVDLTLELGATTQQVEVKGEIPLIDTTSATSGTIITQQEILEMPSLTRIPTLLAVLSPGVQAQDQNNNVGRMWSYLAASEFETNGGRNDGGHYSNQFLLDGMPNQHTDNVAFIPPTDAVQEFRVMSNNYDAQYGRQAGGTINMSVKSGTQNYHGNLYEFNQTAALNAVPFQTNLTGGARPPVHLNLYGGTFGGPVRIPKVYNGREKTFFFFSFEGTRNQDPRSGIRSVPTAAERNGDFTQSFTTQPGNPTHIPILIYDPNTVNKTPGPGFGVRQPFANDAIPADRINSISKAILQFIPMPNTVSDPTGNAVNNFVPKATRNNKMASVLTRVDHTWNNNHKSFASVRWNHETERLGDDFNNVTTGDGPNQRINKGIGLDHVWSISPSKVLDVRYNLTRFEEPTQSHGAGVDPLTLGFSPDFVAKMECKSFPGIKDIFGGIGGGCGGYFNTTYHTWQANLTHVKGNMTLRYGGEFWILQEADAGFGFQSGSFRFGNQWTRQNYNSGAVGKGATMADFLLGLLTNDGGTDHESRFNRNANRFDSQHFYGFYFQNDWRLTPRLTLNMGLRWEYEGPYTERYNRQTSVFDPTVLNPISDAAQRAYSNILNNMVLSDPNKYPFGPQLAQMVPASSFKVYGVQDFAGVGGQPRTVTNSNYREVEPRIGFAYRLRPTTVIRGGFGRFAQPSHLFGGQNGFSVQTNINNSLDSGLTPWDTLSTPFRSGILEPTGSSLGALTNLGQGISWDNQNPGRPHSYEYSFHIQQQLKSWLFEAGYSHNKTYGIYSGLNQNLQPFDLWKSFRTPRFDSSGRPLESTNNTSNHAFFWDDQIPNPFQGLAGVTGSRATDQFTSISQLLRPLKILGDQNMNSNPWGKNQYDALLVKVERRFSKGFSVINSFTWSKLFEDTSFWGPEISGPITEHKLGGEDRPYHLSVAPIWDIPVGRGGKWGKSMPRVLSGLLGGWELSGQYTIQSGTPTVFGTDSFYDGQSFSLSRDQRTLDRWFDTSHFLRFPARNTCIVQNAACTAGTFVSYPDWTGVQNLPGYSFQPAANDPNGDKNGVFNDFGNFVRRYPTRWGSARNSRVNEVNLGIFKNFQIREGMKLQFRLESFNAFNHPRFGGPTTDPGSANFGRVGKTQQNTPRLMQFALKLYF